jgi:hypothetical protein
VAGGLRSSLSMRLPNSNTRAFWALALFVAVQIGDGVLTAVGIGRFGPSIEANPLLVHSIVTFGSAPALLTAKAVAIVAGGLLHAHSYHLVLALLTVAYVFATLIPWAILLG